MARIVGRRPVEIKISTPLDGYVPVFNGSTRLWDAVNKNDFITGSATISGSQTFVGNQTIAGSLTVYQGITGSLFGTASYADNAWAVGGNTFASGSANRILGTLSDHDLLLYTSGYKIATFTTSGSLVLTSGSVDLYEDSKLAVYAGVTTSHNLIKATSNTNGYSQISIQNINTGSSASSNIVAIADNGSNVGQYINVGINSSTFTGSVGDANDAYLYSAGQDLHIGNVSNYPVQLFAGGTNVDTNRKLQLNPNNLHQMTGSLDVSGSVVARSFTGSLQGTSSYATQALTASNANTASSADNFTVRGTLTAQTIIAQTITSSTEFITGSTQFGSLLTDTHQFTGSVGITGSLEVNGRNYINDSSSFESRITTNSGSFSSFSGSYINESSSFASRITTNSSSFTNFSGSYINESSSFASRITTNSSSFTNFSGSYINESSSFASRITTNSSSFASFSGSYINESSSFASRITTNSGSFALFSGSYISESSSFALRVTTNSSSLASFSGSYVNESSSFASRITTDSSSLASFSGSYVNESSSFASRITTNSSSFATFSGSYINESSSFASRITTNSSSFATFSGSHVIESSSFDNRINNISSSFTSLSGSFSTGSFTGSFTGSLLGTASYAAQALTASNANTASSADNFTVRGTLTAQTIVAQTITSSIEFVTGSTKNGSLLSNTHQFTGSVGITGSLAINGSDYITTSGSASTRLTSLETFSGSYSTGSFTGSFIGRHTGSFSGSLYNLQNTVVGHIPFFSSSQVLADSVVTQLDNGSGSFSIAINQNNITTAAPEALYVYQPSATSYNVISGKGNLNNYLQLNIQNTNTGVSASSDIVATANNGNDSINYIDMGINSEGFTGLVGDANDAYLYSTGNDLHIGNASNFPIQFFAGGLDNNANKKFQLNPNNLHQMTGSLDVSGSIVARSFTGSLQGTASWASNAINATSASYAVTASLAINANNAANAATASYVLQAQSASYWSGSIINAATASYVENAQTSSYVLQAVSSSFATTASYWSGSIINAATASYVQNAQTASYVLNAVSASYATSASFVAGLSDGTASLAATASYVLNAVSASYAATASSADNFLVRGTLTAQTINVQTITSSIDFVTGSSRFGSTTNNTHQFTGSVSISGSLGINGVDYNTTSASFDTRINVISSSYATTGSNVFVGNQIITGSFTISGSTTQIGNTTLSGSITVTGSVNAKTDINLGGVLRLDPATDPGAANATASFLFTSASNTATGYDLYYRQGSNKVKFKWFEGVLNTGVLYGGVLTYSSSYFYVSSGSGIIVNHNATTGSEISPTITYVNWAASSHSIATPTAQNTYVFIDANGVLQQQNSFFTPEQYHEALPIGRVSHYGAVGSTVTGVGNNMLTSYDVPQQLGEFARAFGPLKVSGFTITPQVGNLSLNIGSGTAFNLGGYYQNTPDLPSSYNSNTYLTSSIIRIHRSGSGFLFDNNGGSYYTSVNPTLYDDGDGTLATVGNGNWSIQRVFVNPITGRSHVYYGQSTYTTYLSAVSSVATDDFVESEVTKNAYVFAGYLVMNGNASNTNLSVGDPTNAIIQAGLFRNSVGGSGGATTAVSELNDLSDVNISSPSNGQALIYSTGTWINGTPISSSYAATASFVAGISNGTASYANTASFALTASHLLGQSPTASYALTASYADNFTVGGTLTAQTIVAQTITSSIDFVTGSTRNGSLLTNTHEFTGSVLITGSLAVNGSNAILTNQTSSMSVATASFVTLAQTASYVTQAQSASYWSGSILNATSASYANNATSASYALTASYASNVPETASYALVANSSSYALTASYSSNVPVTASYALTANTASFAFSAVSSSFASNANTASFALNASSASFAQTSSYSSYAVYAGNSPGSTSTMTQSIAATTWSFTHNLNTRNPLLQVYDSTNSQIIPYAVIGSDPNQATIYFDVAESGFAVASNGGLLTVNGSTSRLDQTTSAATWSFQHNLATKYPNFIIYDSTDNVVIPAGIYAVNDMSAEIYFAFPSTGVAIANFSGISGSVNVASASYAINATTASYSNNFIVANTLTIDQTLTDYHTVPSSIVGSNNIFTKATGSYSSAFFKYSVTKGSNSRAGEVMAAWVGGTLQFTDNSTLDIGDTSGVTAAASIAASSVQFNLTTADSGWTLKTLGTFM